MPKKIEKGEFKCDMEEYIGSLKESDKHDWVKAVARLSWNDNPTTLDIRSINLKSNKFGKGISLSDDEADRLTNILLEQDYGDKESLIKAIQRKENRFKIGKDAESMFNGARNKKFNIKIEV